MSKKAKKRTLEIHKKYELYEDAVQAPSVDIKFINKEFQRYFKRAPLIAREDFCGTGYFSHTWVKQSPKHFAYGIDLDTEPISYGKRVHLPKLKRDQQQRLTILNANVLDTFKFRSDVTAALNFSYYIFKKRELLVNYFKMVHKGLAKEGMFLLDLFGGTDAVKENVDETEHDSFTYYWDCVKFNIVNQECLYAIHFKTGGKKYTNVFTYDWRMWTPREIRECLEEAGFSSSVFYAEGFLEDGTGDGRFKPTEDENNCEGWVAYIVALKR